MKSEQLIRLITTMSKSEKRSFQLFSGRTGSTKKLYIQLFNYIEKYEFVEHPDKRKSQFLYDKIPSLKKSQLANQKNVLYKQILNALRETNKDAYLEIQAREQFDFAKVLYAKGLYKESLYYLARAKKMAERLEKSPLIYLALDFEKQIESQHITGSLSPRARQLADQSANLIVSLSRTDSLSNLSLLLYGRYLKHGFARNKYDHEKLDQFFLANLPVMDSSTLDFKQSLYLFQSLVWYHYMGQRFAMNYRYATKWVDLFHQRPDMIAVETAFYIKGLHNVLSSLFLAGKKKKFLEQFGHLLAIKNNASIHLNVNEISLLNLFRFIHGINKIVLTAEYEKGIELVKELENVLYEDKHGWDESRLMVFYYKMACIYFGNERYEDAIHWLNMVINGNYGELKQDIQCYARILSLITHYEMKNELLVSNQIVSVYRFLLKMKQLGKVQRSIFIFLRKTSRIDPASLSAAFVDLKVELVEISKDVHERRSFLYLDIISWLDSKVQQVSMLEAIRRNMKDWGART